MNQLYDLYQEHRLLDWKMETKKVMQKRKAKVQHEGDLLASSH